MAEIYSLVYKPSDEHSPSHYSRVLLERAHLMVKHGIEGDQNGGKNPNRQLNIMSYETLRALRKEGFKAQPGELGEQIVVRGLDVNVLLSGTRLQIGDSAVIEIVKPRTGCERFEAIQGKSPSEAAGRLGMMAHVVAEGFIQVGDPVKALEAVAE